MEPSAPATTVLDFHPGADMTWEIVRTVEVFETINTVAARTGGPPIHLHPQAEESYEVLEGALDVFVEGTWRTLTVGEKIVVPPGAPHTVRGHRVLSAKIVNTHRPALSYEVFFREFHRLVSTSKVRLPPNDPRSLLYLALLFSAHPELQQTVKPPQRVFQLLARLGRILGLRLGDA